MRDPAVGPGGIAQRSNARAWGPITAAVLAALLIGALAVFGALAGGADLPGPLQLPVLRERTDPRRTIDPDRTSPAPLPPGNVIGKEGGTRGTVPGVNNPPSGGLDTSLGGGGQSGPTGAGPAGTRP